MSVWRVNFFTRGSSRRPEETSRLAPVRDSDSPYTAWRKLRAAMTQQKMQQSTASQFRAALGTDRWDYGASFMHPFKIYRFPIEQQRRIVPIADLRNAWRTFRVRAGYVFTTTMDGIVVQGTDGILDFPYQESMYTLATGVSIDQTEVWNVIVPVPNFYFYFWVELSTDGTAAVLRWHSDPTQGTYTDAESAGADASWSSDNPWTGWPAPDNEHFLLGWVDTRSQQNIHRAIPRQVQLTDIMSAGSGGGTCDNYG